MKKQYIKVAIPLVYKRGDTVTLNETDLTQIPKVIEFSLKFLK